MLEAAISRIVFILPETTCIAPQFLSVSAFQPGIWMPILNDCKRAGVRLMVFIVTSPQRHKIEIDDLAVLEGSTDKTPKK